MATKDVLHVHFLGGAKDGTEPVTIDADLCEELCGSESPAYMDHERGEPYWLRVKLVGGRATLVLCPMPGRSTRDV